MNKTLYFSMLLFTALSVGFTGCYQSNTFSDEDSDGDSDEDSDGDSDGDSDEDTGEDKKVFSGCEGAIIFPDDALELYIREAINKPIGDIYLADVSSLTTLNMYLLIHPTLEDAPPDPHQNPIFDINGLQCLINLTDLNLKNNPVVDISPLAELLELTSLNLAGCQYISDQIVDITPLAELSKLTSLNLEDNLIVDLEPLVLNTSIGNASEDILDIRFNNYDCDDPTTQSYIAILKERNFASFTHDCD